MMAQVSTSVHNEASAMTVSIHSWQVYCNSCYLQSLSHNGGAVSGAQVLQNSRFLPWQHAESQTQFSSQEPCSRGMPGMSGPKHLLYSGADKHCDCWRCRNPAAGGHWHRRCAGLLGHAAHWLGYQVRSFFFPCPGQAQAALVHIRKPLLLSFLARRVMGPLTCI